MIHRLVVFLIPFMIGCNSQSLEDYALSISKASEPGENVKVFVSSSADFPPDKRLSYHYQILLKKWRYKPDSKGADKVQIAEEIIREGKFEGDCEDFAAVLTAICKELDITSHVCLGESKIKNSGHAWVEVLISNSDDFTDALKDRLSAGFDSTASIVHRDSLVLSLIHI